MKNESDSFIKGRIRSLKFAFSGAYKLITTEHSVITQVIVGLLTTAAGFYFGISKIEWILQIFAIGLILSIESLNTAVEKMADFVHPDFHSKIGFIKDIAAGAVLFAGIAAVLIGLLIYVPYLLS
jgi:diacylglycerol kinase (ATP)